MILIFDEINFWARLLWPRNTNTKIWHKDDNSWGTQGPPGPGCCRWRRMSDQVGLRGRLIPGCTTLYWGWFQVGEWPPREITQPAHCPVHPCHAPQPCQGPAQIQIQTQKYEYKYMTCTLATNASLSCSLTFPMPSSTVTTYLCTSPSNLQPPVHIVHMVHTHHVSWQVGMRDHRCNWPDALLAGLAL